jgi:phosphate transport system permease protein
MNKRKIEEIVVKLIMITATAFIVLSLIFIIITVLIKGLGALTIEMVTQTPRGGFYLGKGGGILNAIVGSLMVAGGATICALFLSIPIVLYINIYTRRDSLFVKLTRFSFNVLWGIPSIVYGAFGFTLMIVTGLKASLLGAIIVITLLEIPIMSRALDEVIRLVPVEMKEAAFSLGATKLETAHKVIIRQTISGIVTAALIAFGRGIGDAAAVLFTGGYSDYIPTSLFQPVATLPLAIFFQLGTPFPEVQQRAYASAIILTLLILFISILARIIGKKLSRYTIR